MKIDPDELLADAQQQKKEQTTLLSLQHVVSMGDYLAELQGQIETSEDYLSQLKGEFRKLAEETMPEAMQQLGLNSLELRDGTKISIQEVVSASITEENRTAAHEWLRANGYGDIIKNQVVVEFGAGEDAVAELTANELTDKGLGLVSKNEKVHPQTLKAFVKERLKSGETVPADIFKLFVGVAARVNKVKK